MGCSLLLWTAKPITFPTVLLESWVACKPQLCCVVGHQIARMPLKATLSALPSLAVVVVNMHFLFLMVTFLGFLVFYSFHVNFRICLLLFRVRVNIWKQVLRIVYGCHWPWKSILKNLATLSCEVFPTMLMKFLFCLFILWHRGNQIGT